MSCLLSGDQTGRPSHPSLKVKRRPISVSRSISQMSLFPLIVFANATVWPSGERG